ncbi:hypothetical protein I317_01814 [Kwoniella heveanensis CBS 569]|nr:hypothetical protein I317_01814 [Kwoniella heveanensis CBS 569]
MSHFPPFPPTNQSGRYSPSRSYGGDRPPFPPTIPPSIPGSAPPNRDFPPYPYPSSGIPPPPPTLTSTAYHPFNGYPSDPPRPPFPPYNQHSQPAAAFDDHYDPYRPAANVYNPPAAQLRIPPTGYPQPSSFEPPRSSQSRPPVRVPSPPRRSVPPYSRPEQKAPTGPPDLAVTTNPTTVNIGGFTAAVHSLPSSHLPISKYISLNRDDAINLHRQLCSYRSSVWYADGSSRAGEAWSAAVEWKNDSNRSGSKMRGFILDGDALESELGGLFKAAEGFKELLQQSIKDGIPISHELTVFCDSQAAIVAIDTSGRPEALKFDQLWREICSEYLHAHLTLVWIPKDSGVEGHVLADKIATVGASNSYLKRRKERTLSDKYSRPGGGEPEPSASSEPGPWQRGDADPSHHKPPYERPKPRPISPPVLSSSILPGQDNNLKLDLQGESAQAFDPVDAEDEGIQPREGAVFVTHLAVDIFHISPAHPRFANVTYRDPASGLAAIRDLHQQPIKLDSPFALSNQEDLEIWKNWNGQLTVVLHEPPRIVPSVVEADFPDLPDWAKGVKDHTKNDEEETMEVEGQIKEERSPTPESTSRKRDRDPSHGSPAVAQDANGCVNGPAREIHSCADTRNVCSPPTDLSETLSPRKRLRHSPDGDASSSAQSTSATQKAEGFSDSLAVEAETSPALTASPSDRRGSAFASNAQSPKQAADTHVDGHAHTPSQTPRVQHDSIAQTVPTASAAQQVQIEDGKVATSLITATPVSLSNPSLPPNQMTFNAVPAILPPTPLTAGVPILNDNDSRRGSSRQSTAEPSSVPARSSITNSASETQETPIRIGARTLRAHIDLVRNVLSKHETNNWIAHTCLIAHDIDHARRSLQADLFATDECFITGRDLERSLGARGFTPTRVDTFITKVLKVLDGIAAAEEPEADEPASADDVERLQAELDEVLASFPDETKEAMASASRVLEYLLRGKELQEKKRLEMERRVKVLEGMVKVGEVVGGVVRYLLTEDK